MDIATSCGVSESLLNLFDAVVNLDIGNNDEEINYQINHLIQFYTDVPPFGSTRKPEQETGINGQKKQKKEKEHLTEDDLRTYIEDCKKILVKVSQRAYNAITCYLKTVGSLMFN